MSSATAGGRPRHQRDAVRPRVRLILTVNPSRSISNQSVLRAAVVWRAARSSAKVRSGYAVISAASRCSWPANTRDRNFVCGRGAREPVSRRRWIKRCTYARLTPNVSATSSASPLASHARATRSRRSIEYGAIATSISHRGVPRPPYYVQVKNALAHEHRQHHPQHGGPDCECQDAGEVETGEPQNPASSSGHVASGFGVGPRNTQ